MVLMHGFAGGSALFFPIFKDLVKYFDLILIDNIGMGGSSRPNDFNENWSP
jgi:pimeloyl-ACP methyl ester carboxylesterase